MWVFSRVVDSGSPYDRKATATWRAELLDAGIDVPFPADITRTTSQTVISKGAEGQLVSG